MAESYFATLCSNGSCLQVLVYPSNRTLDNGNYGNNTDIKDPALDPKDGSWIVTTAIIIFTMQTGFGLLEAGCVSAKSEINIMVKNALDVVFGGVTFWAFGFAFSFGDKPGANPFIGLGYFFGTVDPEEMGYIYALFLFQLSFATTATTIVSGALAERTKLLAYNIFSMCMTFIYSIPAHWVWSERGFLYQWGVMDIAGCGPVHLVGGVTGLVATLVIGPRIDAFSSTVKQPLPSPIKAILGMFMLWWGWLRFNSGSVFLITSSAEWMKAVRAAVNTIVSSMGGGITSVIISIVLSKFTDNPQYDVGTIVNGVLGSLVSITAICTLVKPWEAFLIGAFGVILAVSAEHLVSRLRIDDPVGVIPVHAVCGAWGMLAVGLFVEEEDSVTPGQGGLFKTGQLYQLGIQLLAIVLITVWTIIWATFFLKIIDVTLGLRLTEKEERTGADILEHGAPDYRRSDANDGLDTGATIATIEENISEHFQGTVQDMFKEMFRNATRNRMNVTISHKTSRSLTLELHMKDEGENGPRGATHSQTVVADICM